MPASRPADWIYSGTTAGTGVREWARPISPRWSGPLPLVSNATAYRDIHSDYRDIHRRYVELLGACGFTPAGRVSAKGVDGNHPPSFHPTTEKRLKRQASETLLETCGFACADLQANRPTLGQTHQRYGDCVVQFRDAKGRDQFTAIVQGSWRDVADLRTYRWSKIATRRGGQDAPLETRERKALKVWVRTTGSSDRRR